MSRLDTIVVHVVVVFIGNQLAQNAPVQLKIEILSISNERAKRGWIITYIRVLNISCKRIQYGARREHQDRTVMDEVQSNHRHDQGHNSIKRIETH